MLQLECGICLFILAHINTVSTIMVYRTSHVVIFFQGDAEVFKAIWISSAIEASLVPADYYQIVKCDIIT